MILAQRAATLASLTQLIGSLPPNLAGSMSLDDLQSILRQMFSDYVWPQVTARLPFEEKWDRLQRMYEVKTNKDGRPRQSQKKETTTPNMIGEPPPELSDTIIFDTVDRLKNLNFFIAWKDRPVQFNRPRFIATPLEDQFYNPTSRKVQGANAILDWNNDLQEVRSKHMPLSQHHYLYGLSFVYSDFVFEIEDDSTSAEFLLIKNIGTTFEPISLRKIWINAQLPISQMDKQACPFFFDLQVRGTVMQNQYHPELNPFGFANLDKLASPQYLFGPEGKAFTEGLSADAKNIQTQMRPEFSGEALWTFFPFLQLPGTQRMERYIVQCYANNLLSGGIVPLRIQKLYHPRKRLPLYGATHIPDLDSGLYTPSIAELLESHYDELVRAKTQFIVNKDWINNPPTEVVAGTPAANNPNVNRPGAVIETSGPADLMRRQPYDATNTTLAFIQHVRDAAQTTGKAVDAILGKAMGGRTTATEASNAFQASMSGVTSDIDNFCSAIYGQYAQRVWENTGKFMPKELRDRICGNVDAPPLSDQDLMIQIGLKTDVGSTFIESIVKQQHFQQAIAASTQSPYLDQAMLWKALFRELKLPEALDAVKDNGFEFQVSMAYDQAVSTYLGRPVAIDPSQDHQIAIRVKTRFLQDTKSEYNQQYAANPSGRPGLTTTQYLAEQIGVHQQFVMLMMQQQMMAQQAALQDEKANAEADREHQLKLKAGNGQKTASGPGDNSPRPAQGSPTNNEKP
jgi:hypothetical protein